MRAWADLCAEDVLVEFPFAPAGTPSRLDGRVAIFEYLRNYPKIIDVHEIDSLEIYPTDRPGHRHRRVQPHLPPQEDNHDIADLGRARRANPAGLRADSAGLARPRGQRPGLLRRTHRAEPVLGSLT